MYEGNIDAENSRSRTDVTYSEQFSQSASKAELPARWVEFHKRNFAKHFGLAEPEFAGKSVLETGAGPGKHAAILHLLGANVTAVDFLDTNIQAIQRLSDHHGFANLRAYQADLMQPLPVEWPSFDLASAHNWLQHASEPALALRNIVAKLKVGGRLYLSVYQAGTFRFFVNQIARAILTWNDRAHTQRLAPLFFPLGFLEFNNPDDIYYENIFDDYFVPYMWTFEFESLVDFLGLLGCEVSVPYRAPAKLYEIDNEYLKVGFIKTSEGGGDELNADQLCARLEKAFDAFDLNRLAAQSDQILMLESANWAAQTIDILRPAIESETGQVTDDMYTRTAVALGLYRIRAAFSKDVGVERRHRALQQFLKQFVSGDLGSSRAWESSQRYYQGDRSP